MLGKALRDGYRQKVKVATKLPSWILQSRADMDRFLTAQLKKLGTNRIDYYLVHALDGKLWDNVEQLGVCEFLDQARKDGRISNASFSYHGLAGDFRRIVDAFPWVFCQIQYNYLDEDNQAGTAGLEYAAAKGLNVIVMEPLRGGNLALPRPPAAVAALWDKARVRRTPAEWALRWVWNRPEVTVVLSGMTRLEQVQENLSIAGTAHANSLTEDELTLVHRAGRAYRDLMKVNCTGCGYCMPCPTNVKIPLCFEEYNTTHMFGSLEEGKFRYALRLSGELVDGQPGYVQGHHSGGEAVWMYRGPEAGVNPGPRAKTPRVRASQAAPIRTPPPASVAQCARR